MVLWVKVHSWSVIRTAVVCFQKLPGRAKMLGRFGENGY
jgi:hypothetical protein